MSCSVTVLIDSDLPVGSVCETTFPRGEEISSHSRPFPIVTMRHPNWRHKPS